MKLFEAAFYPEHSIESILVILRDLSWGAAKILLAYSKGENPPNGFSKQLLINEKPSGPQTSADLAVNSWILTGLKKNFSTSRFSFLSEESNLDESETSFNIKKDFQWIIDPLDGTKDFIQGTGEYAVHIGLIFKKEPIMGVVIIPELDELWFGVKGIGSWCEDSKANLKPVNFNRKRNIEDMVLVVSKNHLDVKLQTIINALGISKINKMGSVGYKIAAILRGDADFYLSISGETAPKDWDILPPSVLLDAAGGTFTHVDEKKLSFQKLNNLQKGCLLASNGDNHNILCKKIDRTLKKFYPEFKV